MGTVTTATFVMTTGRNTRQSKAASGDEPGSSGGRHKAAELASGLGPLVRGAGLALILPEWLRANATPLLVGGVVVHGAGMTLKHRVESRRGPPPWWERALFWAC